MPIENELMTFSIRIPKSISDQIENQAKVLHRSRNVQVLSLLTMALDIQAARDEKLKAEMRGLKES